MSEEKNTPQVPASKKAAKPANKPVVVYIMILFIAAFLLMALSLLMSQRSNTEALGNLQNSVSAIQEVQSYQEKILTLQDEMNVLQDENARLKEELDQALSQLDALPDALSHQEHLNEETIQAMDLFWQIDEAYVLGRDDRCRDLIRTLEKKALAPALPAGSTTDNGRFSPYDRYAEICEALGETYGAGVKE